MRILNYKRNGAPFWNMFTLAPMKDSDGTIRFLVGVQVGPARGGSSRRRPGHESSVGIWQGGLDCWSSLLSAAPQKCAVGGPLRWF